MANQSSTAESLNLPRSVERSAWMTLIGFFILFCALVAGACWGGWRYYVDAMSNGSGALVRVHAPTGVSYQERGSTTLAAPSKRCEQPPSTEMCQSIGTEDRILAVPQAGYGPVASLLLPDRTHIQLWAYPTGADLTLNRFKVSRWSGRRQEVALQQTAGYVRYDVPSAVGQPFAELNYTVAISNGIMIDMAPGGSYSVDVPQPGENRERRATSAGTPMLAEVAVRAGSASVRSASGSVIVHPGEKLAIDTSGALGQAEPAAWDLIRDGDFEQLERDMATGEQDAWQPKHYVFDSTVTTAEKNAEITVHRECKPHKPSFCAPDETTNIAQFEREGGQTKSFGIGITQELDQDISEFHTLNLALSARIINQSVSMAGVVGLECPVMIQLLFKENSATDREVERRICFYRNSTGTPIPSTGEIIYQAVGDQPLWTDLSFDLRDPSLLGSARYLESIYIYAVGHDYISQVANVALLGRLQR